MKFPWITSACLIAAVVAPTTAQAVTRVKVVSYARQITYETSPLQIAFSAKADVSGTVVVVASEDRRLDARDPVVGTAQFSTKNPRFAKTDTFNLDDHKVNGGASRIVRLFFLAPKSIHLSRPSDTFAVIDDDGDKPRKRRPDEPTPAAGDWVPEP